jgi:hypothetical protein
MSKLAKVMKKYNISSPRWRAYAPEKLLVKTDLSDEWSDVHDYNKHIKSLDLPKGSKIHVRHVATMCWSEVSE